MTNNKSNTMNQNLNTLIEKYLINSESSTLNTSIDKFNKNVVKVGEKEFLIEEIKKVGSDVLFVKINNKNYSLKYSKSTNEVVLNTGGFTYKYSIKTESQVALEKIIQKSGSKKVKNPIIKSPMPGLVVKINTEVGAAVKKGDKLIVIEAMKMENALASPFDGVVKSITAVEGTAVEKDAVLITLE